MLACSFFCTVIGIHTQRLLLEEEEDGVKELEVLGEVVELCNC
jgi:hypothetical protein